MSVSGGHSGGGISGGGTPHVHPELGPELPGLTCLGRLGSGGFADVYLYERDHPRIRVAVKLMKSADLSDAQRRQFTAEAEVMAELAEHPYIVPVLGAGTTEDGRPYLVMRYYPNADLAVRVRTQPLSVPDALKFGIQLASAVETAHRAGIIHRDIKPSNVLLTAYGVPGLSDFGIAGRPAEIAHEQEIGISMPWSPPEVLAGSSNGSVASDVYSLAATVWNLLVGRSPYAVPLGDNSDRALFTRIVHSRAPTTGRPDAPASLDRILQQALAKDPDHRPQTAMELARHFQRIEQELRLARTEIVVLDREPALPTPPPVPGLPGDATAPGSPTAGPSGEVPAAELPTAFKAPSRVDAQPLESDATAWPGGSAAKPTVARPARVGDGQRHTAASGASEERASRGRLLAVVATVLLLAVAVVVGVLLSRGGGDSPGNDAVPSPPVDTTLPDVQESSLPAPHRVHGRILGDHAVFRWTAVAGATEYLWTGPDGASSRTSALRVTLPLHGASGRVCIQVSAVGHGTVSQAPKQGCAH